VVRKDANPKKLIVKLRKKEGLQQGVPDKK
jgi:hypothetical protein